MLASLFTAYQQKAWKQTQLFLLNSSESCKLSVGQKDQARSYAPGR
jgi:hypothetical protein